MAVADGPPATETSTKRSRGLAGPKRQNLFDRYRYPFILLGRLVRTDFKLRYHGSALGYLWSLLRPLFLFVVLYFVFARFLKLGAGIPHFPQYLLLGIVLWNYFAEVTANSIAAIVGKGDLLRKIDFPKYVIILAGSFSAFINLLLNLAVLGVFLAVGRVHVGWNALLIVPLIAELFVFGLALSFVLSALYVRFRDVAFIWEVFMQAAFYATPILYSVSFVPQSIAQLQFLSPMAQIIQDARYVLVTDQTQTIYDVYDGRVWVWLVPLAVCLVSVILAATYFRSRSKYFAEEI
ncbi:ABC transporter permease [Catellatospora paridis]|uniref:ABC transporter permease n=1 Tax=Catellatospora paridis TaxID=1617086 RepID=UPI001E397667|nr:ABC transporter permease [Catellatospora paridis]